MPLGTPAPHTLFIRRSNLMKEQLQHAVNDQIRAEFESAYIYLAASARFDAQGLNGFAHWMRTQWEEETVHALKLYDFLLQRDAQVELQALSKPELSFETPLEAFEMVLEHEQYITGRIYELYQQAVDARDYPLQNLMQWFIDEQVEEEDSVRAILDDLRLVGDSGATLLLLDRELAARQLDPGA